MLCSFSVIFLRLVKKSDALSYIVLIQGAIVYLQTWTNADTESIESNLANRKLNWNKVHDDLQESWTEKFPWRKWTAGMPANERQKGVQQ